MNYSTDDVASSQRGMTARGGGVAEGGDDRLGTQSLRDALADTQVREVSLAEFLAELKKYGRQLA